MDTSLDNLFSLQAGLMRALGVDLDGGAQRPGIGEMSVEAATGLVCEAAEVLESITKMHRAWKPDADIDGKVEHAKEEAVDALFYLTEMFISLGVASGEDLMALVHRKRAIVLTRIVKAAYEKGGGAIMSLEFDAALRELKRYVPNIEERPVEFRLDPIGFVESNLDIGNYVREKERA